MPLIWGKIDTTCPAATARVVICPPGPSTVTLAVLACGFDTTRPNGERCASRKQTFWAWQVNPVGHPPPGGSQKPAMVPPPILLKHTGKLAFFTPGVSAQLSELE